MGDGQLCLLVHPHCSASKVQGVGTNKWLCSGKYEEEVDKARECWTLLNMHKVLAGDKGQVFKDPNGGDGAYLTGFAGKVTKKMGFSIAVYGSKEKRRRLDVKRLGNDEMQGLKVDAFQYVRYRAGMDVLPDCIASRTKPDRHIFAKSNSAREKALERVGARMDAVGYQKDSKAAHMKSRQVFSGFMRKKERAPSPIKGLVRPEDEELIGGVDYEGSAPPVTATPAKGARKTDSPDTTYLEERCRAPTPEVEKPPEIDKDAFFLQKMTTLQVPVPQSVKQNIELSQASSEATHGTVHPSDLSEMEVDAEEEEQEALAQRQKEEDEKRQRKEERKRQRRLAEAASQREEEEKQKAAAEEASLQKRQAEERAKAAAEAVSAMEDDEAQMRLAFERQMAEKRAAKEKAAAEAAAAEAAVAAAAKAAADAAAQQAPSATDDSDSESDSDSDSERSSDSEDEEDDEMEGISSDSAVRTGPYNEGTESDTSLMEAALSPKEDASDDEGDGPESAAFFLRNADPEMLDNAQRLRSERLDEEAEQAAADAKNKNMSEGMKQRLKRVFKARAKKDQGIELTVSDQKDLDWYSRLDVNDDGDVSLVRRKPTLSWEQISKRRRKEQVKQLRADKRRDDRDERRAIKDAEADERRVLTEERKARRAAKEQARLDRRELRDKERDERNIQQLSEGLQKHYRKERDKLQKKKDSSDAQYDRAKARNRSATKLNPFTNVLTIAMPQPKKRKRLGPDDGLFWVSKRPDGCEYSSQQENAQQEKGGAVFAMLQGTKTLMVNLEKPGLKPGTRRYEKAMKKAAEEKEKEDQEGKRLKVSIEPPRSLAE